MSKFSNEFFKEVADKLIKIDPTEVQLEDFFNRLRDEVGYGDTTDDSLDALLYAVQGDTRYNQPKSEPKAKEEDVLKAITDNQIYRESKLAILKAQQKQVGYGLDKYPETLNPNSWDILETIDHIIEESVDKLHYEVMLKIKLQQQLINMKNHLGENQSSQGEKILVPTPNPDAFWNLKEEDFKPKGPKVIEESSTMFPQHLNPSEEIYLGTPIFGTLLNTSGTDTDGDKGFLATYEKLKAEGKIK